MSRFLHQRSFPLNRFSFELTGDGLDIKKKSLFKKEEFSLKFEDIGIKHIKSKRTEIGGIISIIILLALSIGLYIDEKIMGGDTEKNVYLVYLILAFIATIVTIMFYKRSFYLARPNNSNAIEFLLNKPSKFELDEFINELKQRRKEYLITKYGQINRMLSYEPQYNQLLWLFDNNVLGENEYKDRLAQLNDLFKNPVTISGFQINKN